MASSFPGAIDNFTDPLANSSLASPSHAGQHSDLNDAVEKIETYMGLVKVIPTSVSSAGGTAATLAANGTVSIGTANSSVTVNGAFSSQFASYRIVCEVETCASNLSLWLTFGATAAAYYSAKSGLRFDGTSLNGSVNNGAYMDFASVGTAGGGSFSIDVHAPFLTRETKINGTGMYSAAGAAGSALCCAGFLDNATSYTAFTITTSGSTISGGSIVVYGYRN